MRLSARNKRPFWYALYLGKSPVEDSSGHKTGEYKKTYSDPMKTYGNYSAGSDLLTVGEYGIKEQYDRTLVMENGCPIAEDTILWIGVEPTTGTGETATANPHNYVVSKVQDGLDSIKYGLTKVKVS